MNQQVGGQIASFALLRRRRKENLEECVRRLNTSKGVFGVMVTTENWKMITTTFDNAMSAYLKRQLRMLEVLGFAAVRDTDPINELLFLRIQSIRFDILLSIAKDHRVVVIFSNLSKDRGEPLKQSFLSVQELEKNRLVQKRQGKPIRPTMDYSREHVEKLGGKDTVIITEKIGGKEYDQDDPVNRQ